MPLLSTNKQGEILHVISLDMFIKDCSCMEACSQAARMILAMPILLYNLCKVAPAALAGVTVVPNRTLTSS